MISIATTNSSSIESLEKTYAEYCGSIFTDIGLRLFISTVIILNDQFIDSIVENIRQ